MPFENLGVAFVSNDVTVKLCVDCHAFTWQTLSCDYAFRPAGTFQPIPYNIYNLP